MPRTTLKLSGTNPFLLYLEGGDVLLVVRQDAAPSPRLAMPCACTKSRGEHTRLAPGLRSDAAHLAVGFLWMSLAEMRKRNSIWKAVHHRDDDAANAQHRNQQEMK